MTKNRTLNLAVFAVLALLWVPVVVNAAEEPADKTDGEEGEEKEPKTIAELTEESERFDGLFVLFQDRKTGKVKMLIRKEQIGQEFIYFTFIRDGVAEAGHFRGAFRSNTIFSVRKHFDRIEFVRENTSFYFDPASPLSKAADANITHAVLAVEKIAAADEEKGEYLIEADDLFLTESFVQVTPSPDPESKDEKKFGIGKLSEEKSKIVALKNYPENTDVIVEYVYENPTPIRAEGNEVTDSRFVSVTYQHSLIRVPDNDFEPRFEDPRVGYFTRRQTDLTTPHPVPYRDMIERWYLKKKDPGAELSEPVEPIVFWIENTTPYEIRDMIVQGGEAWNRAFETAGFKNALQIKVQPDDAAWDAGDIRYNVLRWTSSPNPRFGGYGPHFENPRTGQTIGADIMLEYVFLTNRMRYTEIFSTAGLTLDELKVDPEGGCSMGQFLHQQTLFGMSALMAMGAEKEERNELIEDAIYRLTLHEIGHTLGLNHNMKASQFRPLEDVHNLELTRVEGITASVMDYPALNIAGVGKVQGEYYDTVPGPYDHWVIEYGYSEALKDPEAEAERLAAILSRSSEPALMFGNDADDMRRPGRGIDPRVMIGDMSSDNIAYAVERMQLVNHLLPKLEAKLTPEGESYQRLLNSYLILTAQYAGSARVLSRYIGGVHVDRSMVGQAGAESPYRPVPAAQQRRAMAALREYVFAPGAFRSGASLYSRLQPQRRGFDFRDHTEDPKIHARVLTIQQGILDFLLDATTLARISDSRLYGNQYELTEVLGDLTNAVFAADVGSNVNTHRQNLQIDYVKRLVGVFGAGDSSEHDYLSQSTALEQLQAIRALFSKKHKVNNETKAHTNHLLFLIEKALVIG